MAIGPVRGSGGYPSMHDAQRAEDARLGRVAPIVPTHPVEPVKPGVSDVDTWESALVERKAEKPVAEKAELAASRKELYLVVLPVAALTIVSTFAIAAVDSQVYEGVMGLLIFVVQFLVSIALVLAAHVFWPKKKT